jgi:hypothetical protein
VNGPPLTGRERWGTRLATFSVEELQVWRSHGRHRHSTLSLTVTDCHSLWIYILILLSLLSFSVQMVGAPQASLVASQLAPAAHARLPRRWRPRG